MHIIFHIEKVAPGKYPAWFTVKPRPKSGLACVPVQLEQAFADRKAAVSTVLVAVETHVAKRYNIEVQEITIEEKP